MHGIKAEHCQMHGAKDEFTTDNYAITTCPEKEYNIVRKARECCTSELLHHGRIIKTLPEMEGERAIYTPKSAEEERQNRRVKMVKDARLKPPEILAVVSALIPRPPISPQPSNAGALHGSNVQNIQHDTSSTPREGIRILRE